MFLSSDGSLWIIAFISSVSVVIICEIVLEPRILGGKPALEGEFPYQVSIRFKDEENNFGHICGGSIISNQHVLTAAHCVAVMLHRFNRFYVSAGNISLNRTQSLNNIDVIDGIIHPRFTDLGGLLYHDIAVLLLEKPLNWSKTIRPIRIATNKPEFDTECVTSGWGYMFKDQLQITGILQKIKVYTRNPNICKTFYKNGPFNEKGMLCVVGVGTVPCKGDSGGPLVCNRVLNGVTSWGNSCDIRYEITTTVFTSVYHYRDWIRLAVDNIHRIDTHLQSLQIKCEYFFVTNILLLFILYVMF